MTHVSSPAFEICSGVAKAAPLSECHVADGRVVSRERNRLALG